MGKVNDYKDAEAQAEKYLNEKFKKAKDVKFARIWKDGDVWQIDGSAMVKKGMMSSELKTFKLQVNAETGDITGYS